MSLEGKAIIVTGASRGIGRAIAEAAAAAGAAVALTARSKDDLDAVAAAIQAAGGKAEVFAADAAEPATCESLVGAAAAAFGRLDGLVNNAGMIEPIAPLADANAAEWARLFQVNLIAPTLLVKAALPHLKATRGVVLNVSSGAAHRPLEGWSAYCASKAALWMQTQALHLEEGADIDVYAASPGTVDTEMQVLIRASGVNPVSRIPRGDLAPASLPAAGMVWLLTERPDDLKGQDVNVRDAAFLKRAGIEG